MMNEERRSRLNAIKHEQLSREHGYEDLKPMQTPYGDESPRDEAAQRQAFNSKEGYC